MVMSPYLVNAQWSNSGRDNPAKKIEASIGDSGLCRLLHPNGKAAMQHFCPTISE